MGRKIVRLGGSDRRAFIWAVTLGTLSLPIAANAQRGENVYRLGVLSPGPAPIFMIPFGEGLRGFGWVEGRDFTLEYRFSGNTPEEADTAARELAALKGDLIITIVTGNAVAARRATDEIPIVMMVTAFQGGPDHQPQDRKAPRPHDSTAVAVPRGSGH